MLKAYCIPLSFAVIALASLVVTESSKIYTDCHDTLDWCIMYSSQGKCGGVNKSYMQKVCSKTCGYCKVKATLSFIAEPSSLVVVEGSNATFQCQAENFAPQPITYFWKYNGTYIRTGNTDGFSYLSGRLFISKVDKLSHAGLYECVAFSQYSGSIISRKARLQIAYLTKVLDAGSFYIVSMPKPLLIKAPRYAALPPPVFEWQCKSSTGVFKPVTDASMFKTALGDLLIPSVSRLHANQYRLMINHPVVGSAHVLLVTVRIRGTTRTCPDGDINFYPTVKNITVAEGANVTFECLAAAKECRNTLEIVWTNVSSGSHLSNTRRLNLWHITKEYEGTYSCFANATSSIIKKESFVLKVLEKPKILETVKALIHLSNGQYLAPANVVGATSFSWYTNGEQILSSSELYRIRSNNSLVIKYPGKAYSGIYQQVFRNEAGLLVIDQDVVMKTAGCGIKTTGLSGKVTLDNPDTLNWPNFVVCSWLIQLPSTNETRLKLTKFEFPYAKRNCKNTSMSLYSGSPATARTSLADYCVTSKKPLLVSTANGPFVTIVLRISKSFLNFGGFVVEFGPNIAIPPTMSTKSAKPSTTKKTSTSKSPSSTFSTPTKHSTALSTKIVLKNTNKKEKLPVGAVIGGVLGGVVAVLLIGLIVGAICYKKRRFGRIWKRSSVKFKPGKTDSLPRFEVRPNTQTTGPSGKIL